jgi:hypothetical protein
MSDKLPSLSAVSVENEWVQRQNFDKLGSLSDISYGLAACNSSQAFIMPETNSAASSCTQ